MANYASLYHQLFTTKRLAKQFVRDPAYLAESELETIEPKHRVRAIRPTIGFILAMYTTYCAIRDQREYQTEDGKWTLLVFSRTRLTQFGEKTPDGAAGRLENLKRDLREMGTPWEGLPETERFVEVCATCYAIESYEMTPGGLPTAVCKAQLALLIPRIFGALKLEMN